MNVDELMLQAVKASFWAGEEIIRIYSSEFAVEAKDDKSPLTLADKNAHSKISELLKECQLPVLSEEGKIIQYEERKNWPLFWMVDPLDGTKEFVKRNGEFTVNIALIENGKPIAGVIYVPVTAVMYFSTNKEGAYKIEKFTKDHLNYNSLNEFRSAVNKLPNFKHHRPFTVVGSRTHMSVETEDFIKDLKKTHEDISIVSMGSSLKICLVAEGVADVYPRFAPTMEWDTAAGHAIAIGAGKEIVDHSTGNSMIYNKENLLNNWFVVR